VGEFNRHGLVTDTAWRDANAADRAGVDGAVHSGGARGFQEVAGAVDIGLVEFGWVFGPETVVGGDVEEKSAAGYGVLEGYGVAEIAGDGFDVETVDLAAGAYQGADRVPALEEDSRDVPAEEA
jgi:hypothetical protein